MLLLTSLYLVATAVSMSVGGCSVLPLGDSITQGIRPYDSYRRWLAEQGGDKIQYVGGMTGGCVKGNPSKQEEGVWKAHHEGHCNWDSWRFVNEVKGILEGVARNGTAVNAVLMHIGTNDIFNVVRKKRSVKALSATAANLRSIITAVHAKFPNATIFLAQVVATTYPEPTKHLNNLIRTLATVDPPGGKGLLNLVSFPRFEVSTHTFDTTHPNEAGERYIADVWHRALTGLACMKEQGTVLNHTTVSPPVVPARAAIAAKEEDFVLSLPDLVVLSALSTTPLVICGMRMAFRALRWYFVGKLLS